MSAEDYETADTSLEGYDGAIVPCEIVHETAKAVLAQQLNARVWFPKSQITPMRYGNGPALGMPSWLLRKSAPNWLYDTP